jgi:type II secretory pathway pseudopilin PulG
MERLHALGVSSKNRDAISLIEVVVVVGIIGVIAGLIVVAIQEAHRSADRVACQNNLFQIGRALHGYVDQRGHFPCAFAVPNTATNAGNIPPTWGWGAILLPFLEEEPLYECAGVATKGFGGGQVPSQPNSYSQTKLEVYRCPADSGPDLNPFYYFHATSNYRAVAGPSFTVASGSEFYLEDWGGVMFPNSRIAPDQITDGLSNTVAVGECADDHLGGPVGRCSSIWAGQCGRAGSVGGVAYPEVMGFGGIVDNDLKFVPVINNGTPTGFASNHPGGAFFVFCDGAVHFVTNELGGEMFARMAGRNDGLQVTIPE